MNKYLISVGLLFNICASILIVLLNKWVYVHTGFPNVTLTFLHFVVTFIGLIVCKFFGILQVKTLPLLDMLPLASTFCGFVVLTNLSLQYNTVGTYQIAKVMTMPCIMIIQTQFYGKKFTTKEKLTLIPISTGVFLNSYYDIKFNVIGSLFATCGVIVTSVYQVWVNTKQKEYGVGSMQLLFYQAPLSASLLLLVIPFFEPITGGKNALLTTHWTLIDLTVVSLSAITAFMVNLSIFWIIGNTSPVTYNMVGHLKFCLTLIGGFLLFHEPISINQLFGISLTVSGVILYTHFKLQQQAKAVALPTASSTVAQNKI
ncbi:SLC35E3 (predicted) [Pycnogonum litorale]